MSRLGRVKISGRINHGQAKNECDPLRSRLRAPVRVGRRTARESVMVASLVTAPITRLSRMSWRSAVREHMGRQIDHKPDRRLPPHGARWCVPRAVRRLRMLLSSGWDQAPTLTIARLRLTGDLGGRPTRLDRGLRVSCFTCAEKFLHAPVSASSHVAGGPAHIPSAPQHAQIRWGAARDRSTRRFNPTARN